MKADVQYSVMQARCRIEKLLRFCVVQREALAVSGEQPRPNPRSARRPDANDSEKGSIVVPKQTSDLSDFGISIILMFAD
jgi:hypothetical protein